MSTAYARTLLLIQSIRLLNVSLNLFQIPTTVTFVENINELLCLNQYKHYLISLPFNFAISKP